MSVTNTRNDFNNSVSAGKIYKTSQFYKFGESEIETSLTTVWSGSSLQAGLYTYPDASNLGVAVQMEILSTSGLDTLKTIAIGGLDVNMKLQSEIITLNGTTPVLTQYEYLRVFRLAATGGTNADNDLKGEIKLQDVGGAGFIYAHIENSDLAINQSQMALYCVPAGHRLLLDNLAVTSSGSPSFKLFWSVRDNFGNGLNSTFNVKNNFNMAGGDNLVINIKHPFLVPEGADFEFRGIADGNRSGDVAINVVGVLEQYKSIPITPTSLTASDSGGAGISILAWNDFTPAESQDQKYFELEFYKTATPQPSTKISVEKDVNGYFLYGLDSGDEYTFKLTFIGYDDKRSTPAITTLTIL